MTVLTENTVLTNISKEHTGIRSGIIENTNIGMLLLMDEVIEDQPIQQLQFNNIEDVDYLILKLIQLKSEMEIYNKEKEREEKERWVEK